MMASAWGGAEPPAPDGAERIEQIRARLKEWNTAPFSEEQYTAYGSGQKRLDDIHYLLSLYDAETQRRIEASKRVEAAMMQLNVLVGNLDEYSFHGQISNYHKLMEHLKELRDDLTATA